jgi:hypothetical protein
MGSFHFPSSPGRYLAFIIKTASMILLFYAGTGLANMEDDPLPVSAIITSDPFIQLAFIYLAFLVWGASIPDLSKFHNKSYREFLKTIGEVIVLLFVLLLVSSLLWFWAIFLELGFQTHGSLAIWAILMLLITGISVVMHFMFYFWEPDSPELPQSSPEELEESNKEDQVSPDPGDDDQPW